MTHDVMRDSHSLSHGRLVCRFLSGGAVRLFPYGRKLCREIRLQAQQIGWLGDLDSNQDWRSQSALVPLIRKGFFSNRAR